MVCRVKLAVLLLAVLLWGSTAAAEPLLQVDVAGGSYDPVTLSVIAPGDTFTLYALLTPKDNASPAEIEALLARTYYIAVALVPQTGPADDTLGTFEFDSSTVSVTADMTYGTPPLEIIPELQLHDGHDLGPHEVYETFFIEVPFTFSSTQLATTYN